MGVGCGRDLGIGVLARAVLTRSAVRLRSVASRSTFSCRAFHLVFVLEDFNGSTC